MMKKGRIEDLKLRPKEFALGIIYIQNSNFKK
jgi:hypothetical protein